MPPPHAGSHAARGPANPRRIERGELQCGRRAGRPRGLGARQDGRLVEGLSVALCGTLAMLVIALAIFAAAAFRALLKGCFELRRSLRAVSQGFDSMLLKSPIVPGVSVILAPSDASPESRALVRRLLDLHFGRHELVLVLDGAYPRAGPRWVQEFHLYPARSCREGLPGHPRVLRVARPDPAAGGGQTAGRSRRRAQRGRQCRAIPRDRAGGSGGRFHPGTSAAFDSPHAGETGKARWRFAAWPPRPPRRGPRGMYRRHRIAASVAGALCRLQRVESPAAGSRRRGPGATGRGGGRARLPGRRGGVMYAAACRRQGCEGAVPHRAGCRAGYFSAGACRLAGTWPADRPRPG